MMKTSMGQLEEAIKKYLFDGKSNNSIFGVTFHREKLQYLSPITYDFFWKMWWWNTVKHNRRLRSQSEYRSQKVQGHLGFRQNILYILLNLKSTPIVKNHKPKPSKHWSPKNVATENDLDFNS